MSDCDTRLREWERRQTAAMESDDREARQKSDMYEWVPGADRNSDHELVGKRVRFPRTQWPGCRVEGVVRRVSIRGYVGRPEVYVGLHDPKFDLFGEPERPVGMTAAQFAAAEVLETIL